MRTIFDDVVDALEQPRCLCRECKIPSAACRHRETGPSTPETVEYPKPFGNILVRLSDLHDVIVKDDIVYTGKFPLGMLWELNRDFVEIANASFIKVVEK